MKIFSIFFYLICLFNLCLQYELEVDNETKKYNLKQINSDYEIIQLRIDNDEHEINDFEFYLHYLRIDSLRFFQDNLFSICVIQNTPIEFISKTSLSFLFKKIKKNTRCEIIFHQTTEMKIIDTKQIQKNIEFVGFDNFEVNEINFVDPETKMLNQLIKISFYKSNT